jgi:hypothetical protein
MAEKSIQAMLLALEKRVALLEAKLGISPDNETVIYKRAVKETQEKAMALEKARAIEEAK